MLIANSLLIAVLAEPGQEIDRLKIPIPAPARRLRRGEEEDSHRPLGPVGLRETRRSCSRWVLVGWPWRLAGSSAALVRLGASDQGTQAEDHVHKAYDLLAEGFGPGFNISIPIVVDVNGDEPAPYRGSSRAARALPGVATVDEPVYNGPKTVATAS